ncbi:Hypothetical protein R9X50_00343100 [Acrodontium crateriforme]|uniref:Kinetochore protein mis14 n=1 Tax=Acrodontium crateriforme TaxID=150365 RepID=A0AAQ3R9E7_9PEZI|nr:Hypothetical protein R9X50_00343100 [Acrodontium crateriforme]
MNLNIFESTTTQPGPRATESAHRKIELQSAADLTYLIANVSRAARQKLDKHLPPDATTGENGSEDAMRRRVGELVEDYIRQTFNAAKDNMCINGMDSKEIEAEMAKAQEGEEIEPFDTRLAQRIQNLSTQIENQTLHLANLRRTAPSETAQKFQETFTKQLAQEEEELKKDEESRLEMARGTVVDSGEMERLDEVQRTWEESTRELHRLKTSLGGTVAKMEKARSTVGLVEGK